MAGDFEHGRQELHLLRADPVLLSLLNAQRDDEPYTESQREGDAEAEASITRGEGISQEEILREFGILNRALKT